jgi:hypothetical protein
MSVRWDKLSSHKIASKFREITASTTNLPLYVCRALIELHVKNGIMIQPTIQRDGRIVSMKFTVVDLYMGYLYDLGNVPVCLCNAVVHSVYRDQTGQRLSFFTQRISIVPTYSYTCSEELINGFMHHYQQPYAGDFDDPFHIGVRPAATPVMGEEWRETLDFRITDKTFQPMYLRDYTEFSSSARAYNYDHEKDDVIWNNLSDIIRITCNETGDDIRAADGSALENSTTCTAYNIAHNFRQITSETMELPFNICRALIREHVDAEIQTGPDSADSWTFMAVDLYLAYLGDRLVCLCNAAIHSRERQFVGPRDFYYDTQRISIVFTALQFNNKDVPTHPRPIDDENHRAPFHIHGRV